METVSTGVSLLTVLNNPRLALLIAAPAAAFLYFETLLRANDNESLRRECRRMIRLENLMMRAGYSDLAFEPFVDKTYSLMQRCADWLPPQHGMAVLLEEFNVVEEPIVQHFRVSLSSGKSSVGTNRSQLLTGAWLKLNRHQYAPYLTGMTMDQYVSAEVEPGKKDVKDLGVRALYDCVFKPMGTFLDFFGLDRLPCDVAQPIVVKDFHEAAKYPVMSILFHQQ